MMTDGTIQWNERVREIGKSQSEDEVPQGITAFNLLNAASNKRMAAPQPPAPCQGVTDTEYYRAEFEKLQAKVSEQRAEIERLNRGMTVYTEAFEAECRTTDEQDALIDVLDLCERFIIAVASDYPVSSKPVLAAIAAHRGKS